MIEYFDNGDLACFDGKSFRRDKKTGYFLNSTIRKRLHVYVWEYYNGEIPKGYEVHHKDMDKNNNEIENLQLLSKSEHTKFHGNMLDENRRKQLRENMIKNVMPKAKAWHSTPEGKEWHSKHAKETAKKTKYKKYICSYCNSEFESKRTYPENENRFCSNKCKSAYRRKMGYDNIVKVCEICGGEFIGNKYAKQKHCENCKNRKNRKSTE